MNPIQGNIPMKTPRFFLPSFILAALFAVLPSFKASAASAGAEAVDEAWSKAITANDLNSIMAVYSKDAVMWLPGAPEAKGREAIRKSYEEFLAANTVKRASFANTHYETMGNHSVGWGEFTLVLSPKKGGDPITLTGRFTVVAKKENGKWVYVVDHASSPPAPAKPGA
jgi:uncharacterized protein (TIGR02246 family)